MTHFATLVLTTGGGDDEVERLLAPYDEAGEWFADGSRWDWWVVGGRYTGLLTPDYNPTDDPLNVERCDLCMGTGERPGGRERFGSEWFDWCKGCNGCLGTGERVKHAPDWRSHDGDRMSVSSIQLDAMRLPVALVTPDWRRTRPRARRTPSASPMRCMPQSRPRSRGGASRTRSHRFSSNGSNLAAR